MNTTRSLQALEKSMARDHTDQLLTDLAEAQKRRKRDMTHRKHHLDLLLISHPLPPPLAGLSGTSGTSRASRSSQVTPPPPPPSTNQTEYTAWMTTVIRLKPYISSIPEELHMDYDTTPDEQVQSSGDEDIGHDHIPTISLRQNWWKPLTEDRPATPEPAWSIPSSDLPVPVTNWASALASNYAPPLESSLLAQTGDMAIFMD
ncbi:hypothetical protein Tco_1004728 [Tanacetum coccineum]|uniref:Uncharacterized protein n=1 Tax=Tanacetum coccineum TaxID=301880 RepID=A0ABQ5FCV8_9ASTR